MKNLTGRYVDTKSIIHQLDPRTKLLLMILFVWLLMNATNWWQYGLLGGFTAFLMTLSKIKFSIYIKGIRPILRIVVFTAILQLLFTGRGNPFVVLGPINISHAGVLNALSVFFRFFFVILLTSVIGLTTKPLDLTAGLEWLLTPLKFLRIPVQNMALMFGVALRFIPNLFDEARRIKKAQESRGVNFDSGNLVVRMQKFLPLVIPVFIGSFYRAKALGDALDVRGYDGGLKRTKYRIMSFNLHDGLIGALTLGVFFVYFVIL
jgi:energy-coupling factor transport system permease protein